MTAAKIRSTDWHVLQVIHRLGAVPQHKLAEHIGLQRSTVNGSVQRLLRSGWLARVGQEGGGRGRPAILLAVVQSISCFAGIDIAADALHCAVVGADGTLLEHTSLPLGKDRTLDAVLEQIDLSLRGVLSRLDLSMNRLAGIWAGVHGAVDDQGVVVTCASVGWRNAPLAERLRQRYACNVLVQGGMTSMNAAAEALMGAGRDADSLVYFHAGRGIGARFMTRGQPLAGASRRAGELGHVVVAPGGAKCACGNKGCLEAVASGPAIAAAVKKLPRRELPEAVRKLLRGGSGGTAGLVQACLKYRGRREYAALGEVLAAATNHLAMGAAMSVAAYDPEVLILGGYLFDANTSLVRDVKRLLPRMVLDWENRSIRVVQAEVITQDRAVGGAAEVCARFWANPRNVVASG